MSDDEANELRLIANEIMHKLYAASQRGQLDILRMYAESAIKEIDRTTQNFPNTKEADPR